MKDYTLVSPSLDGLLSDDSLYFEGVSRPAEYYFFRDAPTSRHSPVDKTDGRSTNDTVVLERYWNDVYNLFLRKLSLFAANTASSQEDSVKLQALLQELIKVKELLSIGNMS